MRPPEESPFELRGLYTRRAARATGRELVGQLTASIEMRVTSSTDAGVDPQFLRQALGTDGEHSSPSGATVAVPRGVVGFEG